MIRTTPTTDQETTPAPGEVPLFVQDLQRQRLGQAAIAMAVSRGLTICYFVDLAMLLHVAYTRTDPRAAVLAPL